MCCSVSKPQRAESEWGQKLRPNFTFSTLYKIEGPGWTGAKYLSELYEFKQQVQQNGCTMFSDKDELGTDFLRSLVSNVSVTAIKVESVKLTEQGQTIFFRRVDGYNVFAEVITTDSRDRVVAVE